MAPERAIPAPEFSRLLAVDGVPTAGRVYKIEAKPAECLALARRFGLPEIRSLAASVRVKPMAGGPMLRVAGRFTADLVQTCVVTLVPLDAHFEEAFEMTFGPGDAEGEDGEVDFSFDDDDPFEPIVDGSIDIGEAVAEHLALALDPFPRAPGASFELLEDTPEQPEKRPSPFAALARLRQKKE